MVQTGPGTPWNQPCGDDPRRRAARHKVNSINCELGVVRDLSATGARIECPKKPPIRAGQVVPFQLRASDGALNLTGRVVWIKRRGLRKHILGVEFTEIRKGVQAAIESLAKFGFIGINGDAWGSAGKSRAKKKIRVAAHLPNYYHVLGVAEDASEDDIRQAYRDMARKYHPDASHSAESQERFIRAKEAYEVLKDNEQRQNYDLRLASQPRRCA